MSKLFRTQEFESRLNVIMYYVYRDSRMLYNTNSDIIIESATLKDFYELEPTYHYKKNTFIKNTFSVTIIVNAMKKSFVRSFSVDRDAQLTLCHYCGATNDLKFCKNCHQAAYCSRKCQVANYVLHKDKCKKIDS